MREIIWSFIFFAIHLTLFGDQNISFEDLERVERSHILDGQVITIRGFLVYLEDGKAVLTDLPNLKSCCIGKEDKRLNQVAVDGLIEQVPEHQAVALKGTLRIHSANDSLGNPKLHFSLQNPVLLKSSQAGLLTYGLIIGAAFSAILLFYKITSWIRKRE